MMKLLGHSLIMVSAALLAGCDGDSQLPKSQTSAKFTEAPQTLTTKTTALPIQSAYNDLRSAVDVQADIAFVGSASGTKVSALRLATRQHLWQLTLDGGVDQLFFDAEGKRLYISTATTLTVVDSMSGTVLTSIEIDSPIVTITYLPARENFARSHLVIGQRTSANEWQISALEPNFLEVMASTTLPAHDDQPALQITAGAGLIWTMNNEGQRLFTIRPYLLREDAIFPLGDHQVVDSLRDTGLMISPDGEWLITGGNNVLSSGLDSDAQTYYEANVHGFDHFTPTVYGGGVFWGDTFGLMVRDDLAPSANTGVRQWLDLGRFSTSQVLSTVSGIYALGRDDELGLAMQWVTSNSEELPSATTPLMLTVGQTFIPFDGGGSQEQADVYLTAKFAAGNGIAAVQPLCYEPCTYAQVLEIPLLDEAQQAYIEIGKLADGPIRGAIVTVSDSVQVDAAKWVSHPPTICSENPPSGGNQFSGDVDANDLDLSMCKDDERMYGLVGFACADAAAQCEERFELGRLSCDGSSIFVDGAFNQDVGPNLPLLNFLLRSSSAEASSSSSASIYGEIGEDTQADSSASLPNTLTGATDTNVDYLELGSVSSSSFAIFGEIGEEARKEGKNGSINDLDLGIGIDVHKDYLDDLSPPTLKTTCF